MAGHTLPVELKATQPTLPGLDPQGEALRCPPGSCSRVSHAKGWRPCDRCGQLLWRPRRKKVRRASGVAA